jgi:hypothetical protein
MELIKTILEMSVNVAAIIIMFAVVLSIIAGAVGFILWLFDRIREERTQWQNWDR